MKGRRVMATSRKLWKERGGEGRKGMEVERRKEDVEKKRRKERGTERRRGKGRRRGVRKGGWVDRL